MHELRGAKWSTLAQHFAHLSRANTYPGEHFLLLFGGRGERFKHLAHVRRCLRATDVVVMKNVERATQLRERNAGHLRSYR